MWNAIAYFQNITDTLLLTKDKYKFCRVTGLNYLEEILANLKTAKAYIAVDDTDEGVTVQNSGGFFDRRAVVIYVLKKYKFGDEADREEKLNETRVIRKKIIAKLLKDSLTVGELMYLDKTRMPYHEVPGMFAAGTCGMYFTITISEPVELIHNDADYFQE